MRSGVARLEPGRLGVLIPRKESNAMKTISPHAAVFASPTIDAVGKAFEEVSASFERFCLAAGIEALSAMMEKDAEEACGLRHCRSSSRRRPRRGACLCEHVSYREQAKSGSSWVP